MDLHEINQRKELLFEILDDLEGDIKKLSERIIAARADLERVKTEEDAVAFDGRYSLLDADLQYIRVE